MVFKTVCWNEIIYKKYVDIGKKRTKLKLQGILILSSKEISKGKRNEMASEMEGNLERRVSQLQKRECLESEEAEYC